VAALAANGPAATRLGEILAADARSSDFANFSEEEFAARAALIEEAGGREWTAEEARRQHTIAIEALDVVDMPDRVREQFTALADFVVVRKR
jgi:geranylgeranyl diphosphate synthase type I